MMWSCIVCFGLMIGGATAEPQRSVLPSRQVVELSCAERLAPLWRVPMIRLGLFRKSVDSFGAPAISLRHDSVLAGTADGDVLGLALADGRVRWRRRIGMPVEGEFALLDAPTQPAAELAVIGLHDGSLVALDPRTGRQIWRTQLGGEVRSRAVSAGPAHLVATTTHNEVVLLSKRDGRVVWTEGRTPPVGLSLQGHARAWVDTQRVFATFSDGFAAAYNLRDGGLIWSRALSTSGGRFVDADAHPLVEDGRLFVASMSDGVFALDPEDGSTLWQHRMANTGALASLGGSLFAAAVDGQIVRLDAKTGRLMTRVRLGGQSAGALAPLADVMMVLAGDFGLALVDAQGRPRGAQALGGRPGDSLTVADGFVAHISRSGYLTLWQDTWRIPRSASNVKS